MQTMTALVRISGDQHMTVQRSGVTPAEALVLMHVHDPATKDVFEDAVIDGEVERTKLEERDRLVAFYPEQRKLIDHLFPGRTASDIPDAFSELEDVPLEVAATAKREGRQAKARTEVQDAEDDAGEAFVAVDVPPAAAPMPPDELRAAVGASRRKKG